MASADQVQRVAVIGHSLVRDFDNFVHSDDVKVNEHLHLDNIQLECYHRRGLTVNRIRELKGEIEMGAPSVVFLILGDNDINSSSDTSLLASQLACAGTLVRAWAGAPKLVHLDIFPRFYTKESCPKYFINNYQQLAMEVNQKMREETMELPRTVVWNCRGLRFEDAKSNNYKMDGVHLNASGNYLLYKGIRKAMQIFKQL